MHISEVLHEKAILAPLISVEKEDILKELIAVLPIDRGGISNETILEAIVKREAITSTGIGEGIAIPE